MSLSKDDLKRLLAAYPLVAFAGDLEEVVNGLLGAIEQAHHYLTPPLCAEFSAVHIKLKELVDKAIAELEEKSVDL